MVFSFFIFKLKYAEYGLGVKDSMLGVQRGEQELWAGCDGEVGIREASKGDGT